MSSQLETLFLVFRLWHKQSANKLKEDSQTFYYLLLCPWVSRFLRFDYEKIGETQGRVSGWDVVPFSHIRGANCTFYRAWASYYLHHSNTVTDLL